MSLKISLLLLKNILHLQKRFYGFADLRANDSIR